MVQFSLMQVPIFESDTFNPSNASPAWFESVVDLLQLRFDPAWPDTFGRKLRLLSEKQDLPVINTLSLFSGGGGLDIGFHEAGFRIVESVEIESQFAETLSLNAGKTGFFPETKIHNLDIADYEPSQDLKIDFIIGGPPCQTFSAAGRRAAGVQGTDDPRGNLFLEYVRILKVLKPTGFLFENVYGIVGAQGGEPWTAIQEAFREAGYKIFWRILDAADYGVPQHRERLFIVGLRDGDFAFPFPTHGPDSFSSLSHYSAGLAVSNLFEEEQKRGLGGQYGALLDDIPPGLNYSFYTAKMGHPRPVFAWRSKFSDFLYKADPETPVRTIKAHGGQYTGPFSWDNRPFSINELKRLQTFPDNYELMGSRQRVITQLGNSVPPQIARILALAVQDQVFKADLPFKLSYMDSAFQLGFRRRKRQLTARYRAAAASALENIEHQDPRGGLIGETKEVSPGKTGRLKRLLSESFQWQKINSEQHIPHAKWITYSISPEAWTFDLHEQSTGTAPLDVTQLNVSFDSQQRKLFNCEQVVLRTSVTNPIAVTYLWKAFEEILREYTGKADLVQLFGYYQYEMSGEISVLLSSKVRNNQLWKLVKAITERVGVGQQYSGRQLSSVLNVLEENVYGELRSLRQLGYEVRSHRTNPQIKEGEYLIPYSFPTLTSSSVQLRKQL